MDFLYGISFAWLTLLIKSQRNLRDHTVGGYSYLDHNIDVKGKIELLPERPTKT